MGKTIRCKMRIDRISKTESGYGLSATPVYSGSPENDAFFKFTPGGQLQLEVVRHETLDHLEPGDEVYLDIVKAG